MLLVPPAAMKIGPLGLGVMLGFGADGIYRLGLNYEACTTGNTA